MRKTLLTFVLLVAAMTVSFGQVVGIWKTIDDETGKAKSYVEIFEKNGKVYGKITKLLNRPAQDDPNPKCDMCTDDRKDNAIIGMEIIRSMKKDGNEYNDGTILDPNNGKIYDCKMWVEKSKPDILNVRGYIAFFYRTQTWHRVK